MNAPTIPGLTYDAEDCGYHLPDSPGCASFMLRWDYDLEAWSLARLWVEPMCRRFRLGTHLLEHLTAWADAQGHTLILFVEPIGFDGMNTSQLIDWYTRFGFAHRRGKNKCALIRRPRRHPGHQGQSIDQS